MVIVFKEEKTNWKYLALIFVFGVFIGAGTIWLAGSL